jgi:hypothetical protein
MLNHNLSNLISRFGKEVLHYQLDSDNCYVLHELYCGRYDRSFVLSEALLNGDLNRFPRPAFLSWMKVFVHVFSHNNSFSLLLLATSAVDLDTDHAIQEIIRGPAFTNVTIFTIA